MGTAQSVSDDLSFIRPARLVRLLEALRPNDAFLFTTQTIPFGGVFRRGQRKPALVVRRQEAVGLVSSGAVESIRRFKDSICYRLTLDGLSALKRARIDAMFCGDVSADAGPVHAAAHRCEGERWIEVDGISGRPERKVVNMGESPLAWLYRRGHLTAEEVEAGERLRDDFERAGLAPRVTQDWRRLLAVVDSGSKLGGVHQPAPDAAAARARLSRALDECGPGLSDVVWRACCFCEGLEAIERDQGWAKRSGKVVLKLALQRLVEFYEIMPRVSAPIQGGTVCAVPPTSLCAS